MTDQLNEFTNENGCPKCGNMLTSAVEYTWWGGFIGPKLLHHTKCNACKFTYNSKSRRSNTSGIIIYSLLLFVVAFAIVFFINKK